MTSPDSPFERSQPVNVHGTAVVIGTHGILFVGRSGSGKSSLALTCLETARHAGLFSSLVADDQVFIEHAGGHIIATRPPTTAGLIEVRYSGIAEIESISAARLHMVVLLVSPGEAERLPPDAETHVLQGVELPCLRLSVDVSAPFSAISGFISWRLAPLQNCDSHF